MISVRGKTAGRWLGEHCGGSGEYRLTSVNYQHRVHVVRTISAVVSSVTLIPSLVIVLSIRFPPSSSPRASYHFDKEDRSEDVVHVHQRVSERLRLALVGDAQRNRVQNDEEGDDLLPRMMFHHVGNRIRVALPPPLLLLLLWPVIRRVVATSRGTRRRSTGSTVGGTIGEFFWRTVNGSILVPE